MRRSLRRTFFHPERPTLTSCSLQSITRPFQKRFREVFGNARILIFYLSIKAWEEKSLPKSHLGWFFLVFGEGKATKENMSIFWFIWPLNNTTINSAIFFQIYGNFKCNPGFLVIDFEKKSMNVKWQNGRYWVMFNSGYFCWNFKSCGAFCSHSTLLYKEQFFYHDYLDLYEFQGDLNTFS